MKKYLSLVFMLCFIFVLSACGQKADVSAEAITHLSYQQSSWGHCVDEIEINFVAGEIKSYTGNLDKERLSCGDIPDAEFTYYSIEDGQMADLKLYVHEKMTGKLHRDSCKDKLTDLPSWGFTIKYASEEVKSFSGDSCSEIQEIQDIINKIQHQI